jgi:hypothetical protein
MQEFRRRTFNRNLAPSFFKPGRSSNFHSAPEIFSASITASKTMVKSSEMALFIALSSRSNNGIIVSVGTRSDAAGLLLKRLNRNAIVQTGRGEVSLVGLVCFLDGLKYIEQLQRLKCPT